MRKNESENENERERETEDEDTNVSEGTEGGRKGIFLGTLMLSR